MCLVVFALAAHPELSLVVAANRDEVTARPSERARFWDDAPFVLAGRDLDKGGTWMGITRTGRFAALTNVRDPSARREAPRSRGTIVAEFLRGDDGPEHFSSALPRAELPAFNLICGSVRALSFLRDDSDGPLAVAPGVHGLSNARLDVPWPKVERGKRALTEWLGAPGPTEPLFTMLGDRSLAADEALPSTGVPLEIERELSAARIVMPDHGYGTRCSTVLTVSRAGEVHFEERTWDARGAEILRVKERFLLE